MNIFIQAEPELGASLVTIRSNVRHRMYLQESCKIIHSADKFDRGCCRGATQAIALYVAKLIYSPCSMLLA